MIDALGFEYKLSIYDFDIIMPHQCIMPQIWKYEHLACIGNFVLNLNCYDCDEIQRNNKDYKKCSNSKTGTNIYTARDYSEMRRLKVGVSNQ